MFFRIAKFFLYAAAFTVVLVTTSTLFPFIVGKYVFFRVAVDLALAFFALGLVLDPAAGAYLGRLRNVLRTPLVLAVVAFAFIFVLAGLVGVQPAFSFWSNFERGEGGLQMLHLLAFFLLLTVLFREAGEWRRFFKLSIAAAGIMVAYGVVAGIGVGRSIGPAFGDAGYRFQGTIGNAAYVAAYLLFTVFYLAVLFFSSKNPRRRYLIAASAALLAVFTTVFYFTGTRGGLMGLLGGALLAGAYYAMTNRRARKFLPAVGVLFAVVLILLVFGNTALISSIPGSRIFNISFTGYSFASRAIMWSTAFHAWQDRPLLGYGPESFLWIFDRYFEPRYLSLETFEWFDRAHSLIFDYLSAAGILGLLSFAAIFIFFFALVLRAKDTEDGAPALRTSKVLFIGIVAAYLIQGLTLFDVLVIQQQMFVVLAFAIFVFADIKEAPVKETAPGPAAYAAALIVILASSSAAYFGALLPYVKASRFIAVSSTTDRIATVDQFRKHFDYAVKFPSPVGQPEVAKFLAGDIVRVLPGVKQSVAAHSLVEYVEPYLLKTDVRHLLLVGQMRYTLWSMFKEKADLAAAEAAFRAAHDIGPRLPQPIEGLITVYDAEGETAKADEFKAELKALRVEAPSPQSAL